METTILSSVIEIMAKKMETTILSSVIGIMGIF